MPRSRAVAEVSRAGAGRTSRAAKVLAALHDARPRVRVELRFESPLELLVATILSAQCTDERVNQVTPSLFRAWPDAAALAHAPLPDLDAMIRSTGFFRAKARSIRSCCQALLERHCGGVPRTMDELVLLPGVGRKTANVVLGAAFGIASGIVVDTHMARVAARLGLTKETDPERIERDLMDVVPRQEWIFFSIAVILHGRHVCQARRPRCGLCPLNPHCPSNHLEGVLSRGAKPVGSGRRTARRRNSRDRREG